MTRLIATPKSALPAPVARPRAIAGALFALVAMLATIVSPSDASAQNPSDVVINEIFYHPPCIVAYTPCNDAAAEFIEIHNSGANPIDISGWSVNDGVEFVVPAATTIPAGGYYVIVDDQLGFESYFGAAPSGGQWIGSLSNSGERVALVDNVGTLIDEITYSDGAGTPGAWSVDADGNGDSLSLLDAQNADGTSFWWDSAVPTPDAVNANAGTPPTAVVENFVWSVWPLETDPIELSADIFGGDSPVLEYLINYPEVGAPNGIVGIPMTNVGGHSWTATIPATAYNAGDLVRFRIQNGGVIVAPRANDTIDWVGTTIADPSVDSSVPVVEWFTNDANYTSGYNEQGSTFYDGVLAYNGVVYDNVGFRIRGAIARSASWTKRNWKFSMPDHHNFYIDGISYGLDTMDMQGGFADEARIREVVGHTVADQMGLVAAEVQHVQIRKNGEFFGLHTMQEHPEGGFLDNNDLDNATLFRTVSLSYESGPPHTPDTAANWETWDIPEYINMLAGATVIQHNDYAHGNFYSWYDRDEHERQEGMIWDLDLSQGIRYAPTAGLTTLLYNGSSYYGVWRRWEVQAPLFNKVLTDPTFREMYLRRVRTLADEWFGTGAYEQLARDTFDNITGVNGGANLWALDTAEWGFWGGQNYTQIGAINRHSDDWIDQFYAHILAGGPNGDIPAPQPANPNLSLFVDAAPLDQRNEHVRIQNNENVAIDISGWQLGGSGNAVLPPGSVIPANASAYVVDNDRLAGFRAVTVDAHVLGEYDAPLPDPGGAIDLTDPNGTVHASVVWGAGAPPIGMHLNEWNAVSSSNFLLDGDVTLGTIPGNGGDWFELVVVEDHLDIRNWELEITDGGVVDQVLTFSNDPLLADIRAGTIITIAEDPITDQNGVVWGEDPGYNPYVDDWWIHFVAGANGSGQYITAANFRVSNDDWQLSIYDENDVRRFGPAGEGVGTLINGGISSSEIGELEEDPSTLIGPLSAYDEGNESTFGLPNNFAASVQDFTAIRPDVGVPGDVNCSGDLDIGDALYIAQHAVSTRFDGGDCPVNPLNELRLASADINQDGVGDVQDALIVAQCDIGIVNGWCS